MSEAFRVAVIIPAHNAEASISMAVTSALSQPEVAEVIVVDDASSDGTSHIARRAGGGDDRLVVLRQDENIGPAEARNIAIERSSAPFVALLDADDYLLPDRFKPIFARRGWDMIADNIVFVPETRPTPLTHQDVESPAAMDVEVIDKAAFLRGNIADSNGYRGELGFLKPVMSRAFLVRHGLRYDSRMRLGEDFRLYFEMLLAGARFEVLPSVGYVARVRQNSLSGRHSATDLRNLLVASTELAGRIEDDAILYPAMAQYLDALRRRYLLHDFLEVKRNFGLSRAARRAFSPPRNALPIASGVFRDKWISLLGQSEHPVPPKRYLFPIR